MDKSSGSTTTRLKTRREVLRRRRRERQILVFGILTFALATVGYSAYSMYQGEIESPFSAPFVTNIGGFNSDVKLPCPEPDSLPMPAAEVVVRTLNGTDFSGLAGSTLEDLDGRGYYTLTATNWSRTYEGVARIMFGEEGVQQAYTIAREFPDYELVLDSRDNAVVDIVLGKAFLDTELVPLSSADRSPDLPLSARAKCLPVGLIEPEPAPRTVPEDPLASPSPSPSASDAG